MVAVFNGRWGEDIAKSAASGVNGASAFLMGAGATNESKESCKVIVTSDALSSSAATVDEEPQVNTGSSMGTGLFPITAMSTVSTVNDVGSVVTSPLPHALRQVITVEGHPSFGTEYLAKVMSQ
jgi:hypothetical protein